jgi:acetyl esterase/lipase
VSVDTAKYLTVARDVTYSTADGVDLQMDIYHPSSDGPWPGVIWVHGGGWMGGDKAPLPETLAGQDYLVASINYRMYPAHRFPAMVEDVKAAIRYLRAHAAAHNLDADHIALVGHSAGGHLVALAGLADESVGWDVGPYLDQSSRVQAVVEMAGPTDLTRRFPDWADELLAGVFGPEQLVSGSPVTYVRRDSPRFMIVHGSEDDVVLVEQAHVLHAALVAAGVPVETIILQNAGHGFEPVGGVVLPSLEHTLGRIRVFLLEMANSSP